MKYQVTITATIKRIYTLESNDENTVEDNALDLFHNEIPLSDVDLPTVDIEIKSDESVGC